MRAQGRGHGKVGSCPGAVTHGITGVLPEAMDSNRVSDNFERGDPYEYYMGRWSRRVAPLFLEWLGEPPGRRWLDIGCGTGALCAAILDRCAPTQVTGVEPSEGFRHTAQEMLKDCATILAGSATSLPLDDNSVDATVSALMLNFVADPPAALREMARVTSSGGTIAACVWDYAEGMQMIRIFWDTVVALDPLSAHLDEATRFPLCHRERLKDLFVGAGLLQVEVAPLEIETRFADFDDYWKPFLGGQGPAPACVASLDDVARRSLMERLRERLPTGVDATIDLTARAWAVRGTLSP